jgi:hypothetical protein
VPDPNGRQTWVLDTCVLHDAAACGAGGPLKGRYMLGLQILAEIYSRHQIAEDRRGLMAREYNRAWARIVKDQKDYPSYKAAWEFWNKLFFSPHVQTERTLPEAVKAVCIAANMKPDGDIAFVEAANGTNDKLIATEDSDYSDDVCTVLKEHPSVGITALKYADAFDKMRESPSAAQPD